MLKKFLQQFKNIISELNGNLSGNVLYLIVFLDNLLMMLYLLFPCLFIRKLHFYTKDLLDFSGEFIKVYLIALPGILVSDMFNLFNQANLSRKIYRRIINLLISRISPFKFFSTCFCRNPWHFSNCTFSNIYQRYRWTF